jgi:hypothetical protein
MKTRLASYALGLALLAAPLAAEAQQTGKVVRIGFLRAASPQPADLEAFRQGLRDLGHVESLHIMIEPRYAAGVVARLPDLATELVRLQPDVIVVDGTLAAKAAGAATPTIPIVFTLVSDPVASGLVASLARPGRNLTGLSNVGSDLSAKRLQLLKEALVGASRIAVLSDPTNAMTCPGQKPHLARVGRKLPAVPMTVTVDSPQPSRLLSESAHDHRPRHRALDLSTRHALRGGDHCPGTRGAAPSTGGPSALWPPTPALALGSIPLDCLGPGRAGGRASSSCSRRRSWRGTAVASSSTGGGSPGGPRSAARRSTPSSDS